MGGMTGSCICRGDPERGYDEDREECPQSFQEVQVEQPKEQNGSPSKKGGSSLFRIGIYGFVAFSMTACIYALLNYLVTYK